MSILSTPLRPAVGADRFELKFVLDPPQADLDKAIAARTAAMLNAGWPEEVRSLLENGLPRTAPAFRAIGYDSVIELLEGRLGEEDAKASQDPSG